MTQEPCAKYKYPPMKAINRRSAAQGDYGTLRGAWDPGSHAAVTVEWPASCLLRSLMDNQTALNADWDITHAKDVLLNCELTIL